MNDAYIKLGIAALLPVAVAVILFVIDKYTPLGRMNRIVKQVIFGIIFGGLAVIGTEYGIPLNGAQCNCRDAAVLVGGLMFGAPTGISAGVIGGVERWIAVAWGVGSFTRIACSASTIIAGIYSALLRKFMFEDKRPGWLLSLAVGVVMEVFHLTMVFITNMATPIEAMAAVKACAVPMIIANGVSVMLASMMVSVVSGEYVGIKRKNVRISQTVQRRLLVTVILAFLATSYFVFSLQDKLAVSQADSLLELAIDECSNDIIDSSGENVGGITKNSHVGKTGYVLIFDENSNLISAPKDYSDDFDVKVLLSKDENETFALKVGGSQSYCRFRTTDGYRIVSVLPES
ncbi:MAG: hypothetical protein MJ096_01020, partial [Clostridia bacterium]|nr:hypothetical protein [Clostridia bacterium]